MTKRSRTPNNAPSRRKKQCLGCNITTDFTSRILNISTGKFECVITPKCPRIQGERADFLVERYSKGIVKDAFSNSVPGADVVYAETNYNIIPNSLAHLELNGVSFYNKTNCETFYNFIENVLVNLNEKVILHLWFSEISRAVRCAYGRERLAQLIKTGRVRIRLFSCSADENDNNNDSTDIDDKLLVPKLNPDWYEYLVEISSKSIAKSHMLSIGQRDRCGSKRGGEINKELKIVRRKLNELSSNMKLKEVAFSNDLVKELLNNKNTTKKSAEIIESLLAQFVPQKYAKKLLFTSTGNVRPKVEKMLYSTPGLDMSKYKINGYINSIGNDKQFYTDIANSIGSMIKPEDDKIEYSHGLMCLIGWDLPAVPGNYFSVLKYSQWSNLYDYIWYTIRLKWLEKMRNGNHLLMRRMNSEFKSHVHNPIVRDIVNNPTSNNSFFSNLMNSLQTKCNKFFKAIYSTNTNTSKQLNQCLTKMKI